MLKRENRLTKIVRRTGGEKYSSALFNIKVFDNKENEARFGFVVSKKIDKRAVVRNRTKRVLRMVAEEFLKELVGKDVVIIAKKSLTLTDKEMVAKELRNILKK
ncbi:MAG TPA: ribonuclease P protein component [Patescibacteria group bacterium]|jgi:ribonuclease P protein component|nr:ribonuclease P protein component [Patescibacteria group bacterium]